MKEGLSFVTGFHHNNCPLWLLPDTRSQGQTQNLALRIGPASSATLLHPPHFLLKNVTQGQAWLHMLRPDLKEGVYFGMRN